MSWKLQILKYKDALTFLSHVVDSVSNYALTKSKFTLVGGALSALTETVGTTKYNPHSLYSSANNWGPIFDNEFDNIFTSVLNKLPCTDIPFNDPVKHYSVDGLEFVNIINAWDMHFNRILAPFDQAAKIREFLVSKKLEELNSQILYVEWMGAEEEGNKRLSVSAYPVPTIKPKNAEGLIEEVQKAFDLGMHRSYLLFGPAGSGKSTIANTLPLHFNLRTLRFRAEEHFSPPLILELIDLFKIESVVFDDFDQEKIDAKLFSFLEICYEKVKLMIGVANSLEDFHPALLRPKRFDSLIKIDSLDEDTVKELLGDLYEKFGEKVKHFPVAYLNEIKYQSQLNPEKLEEKINNLSLRVDKMLQAIGSKKKKIVKKSKIESK